MAVPTPLRPAEVPTVEDLVEHPERVGTLPPEVAASLAPEAADREARWRSLAVALLLQALSGAHGTPAPAGEKRLLTAVDVASYLQVRKAAVYEMIRKGEIATVRLGRRRVRVPPQALDEWITAHTHPARLPRASYTMYSGLRGADTRRDGRRDASTASRPGRPDPGATRRAPRGDAQHGRPVGARRGAHPRTNGPADPAHPDRHRED